MSEMSEDWWRDFFDMDKPSKRWADPRSMACKEVVEEALALAKGEPPEINLMAYIELIHAARKLGLKVVKP